LLERIAMRPWPQTMFMICTNIEGNRRVGKILANIRILALLPPYPNSLGRIAAIRPSGSG
jgi:hypothetical protein